METIRIVSERLELRPRSLDEMKELFEKEQEAEMLQVYREMIASMEAVPDEDYWACDWKIMLKTGEIVGGIGFKGVPDGNGEVEVGYAVEEEYRRKGYATEAVGAISGWALTQPGVSRVLAQTEPTNAISQRVLLSNGFVRCGDGEEGPLFKLEG